MRNDSFAACSHGLPASSLRLVLSALVTALAFGLLLGACQEERPAKQEPLDPALKNVLSNSYCLQEAKVSLICGVIDNYSAKAHYRLQVSDKADFAQLVIDERVSDAKYGYPSKLTGNYHWRLIETGSNPKVLATKSVELVNFYNDDDGDGLSNGLEMNGLLAWDLPSLGTNYQRKDIIVYMDTMNEDYLPSEEAFAKIIAVFSGGPVANPNGQSGINLILIQGKTVPFDSNLEPVAMEFNLLKQDHFPQELHGIAHYMIWAHAHSSSTSSGYSFGIPASDFIVTLGSWLANGTDQAKIGTFIHELGHNLGLRHGGTTDQINSPNYLSVMNYDFQIDGVMKDGKRYFDYQRIATEPLNEMNLNELLGIGDEAVTKGYGTIYRCTSPEGRRRIIQWDLSSGIDWNCDGVLTTSVASNVIAPTGEAKTLVAHNDWDNLNLAAIRASSEGGVGQSLPAPKELTLEQHLDLKASLVNPASKGSSSSTP